MSSAELHDGFVRIVDADRAADFHVRWLRHNCDVDRHPTTGERIVDSADLPDVLDIEALAVENDALVIRWAHDQRISRFSLGWLREHAYATDRASVPRPPSDVARLVIDGSAGPSTVIDELLTRLASAGAALIRREVAVPRPRPRPGSRCSRRAACA